NLAMDLIRQNAGSVSEIAYRVGFSSPSYFNRCFMQHFGCTPTDAKKGAAKGRSAPESSIATIVLVCATSMQRAQIVSPYLSPDIQPDRNQNNYEHENYKTDVTPLPGRRLRVFVLLHRGRSGAEGKRQDR